MKKACKGQGVLSLCWLATAVSVASSSTTTVDTATLRSMGLSRKEVKDIISNQIVEEDEEIEEIDEEEEPWKSNENWWQDPLAMFSDDEAEDDEVSTLAATVEGEEEIIEEPIDPQATSEKPLEVVMEAVMEAAEDEMIEEGVEVPVPVDEMIEEGVEVSVPVDEIVPEPKNKAVAKVEAKQPIVMKAKVGNGTGALAVLIPLVAKIQSLLPKVQSGVSSLPVVPLMVSALLAKVAIESVMSRQGQPAEHAEYIGEEDDEPSLSEQTETSLDTGERVVNAPSTDEEGEDSPPTKTVARRSETRRNKPAWVRGIGGMFARSPDGGRMPRARELYEQVQSLRASLAIAEAERDGMEKEYEKTSFQLQEAQTELATLTTTTRYLKAQLRDNEEVQNKVIREERRKAKEELARMKKAMVSILDKERRAMREELKRQTSELRGLLMDATGEDGNITAKES